MKNLTLSVLFITLITSCSAQRNYGGIITEKNGKVGIGTAAPDELLTVKGKIHTQEVLVDLNGAVAPDYVFTNYFEGVSKDKPDYNLMSLAELSTYLETYHHLPEVPSAAEMEVTGIKLKKMNLLLLQKIEELTLYTLEQQKEIDQLKKRLGMNH